VPRTEVELSARTTFAGIAILLVPMVFFYAAVTDWNFGVAAIMALIMVVTGFLFSAVGAYMAGIVGSSNNPISGVTILTLMVSAFALKFLGVGSDVGAAATIFVAGVIAVAGSIASDNLQDLKAGHILGSTPRKQQLLLALGAVFAAFFLAPVLNILVNGVSCAAGTGIQCVAAPQANLMASITRGIFDPASAGLPYPIIGFGALFALLLILVDQTLGRRRDAFKVPVMAVAVGLYLPIDTTMPIFVGGLVAWTTGRVWRRRTGEVLPEGSNPGVLFASGLIAGEALLGILTSALVGANIVLRPSPLDALLDWPGLVLLGYLAFLMAYVVLRRAPKQA
jgi:putative OPT family oligopeptide transporter